MDVVQRILRWQELKHIALAHFGPETASALEDRAVKTAELSGIDKVDMFTLIIQMEMEFPGRADELLDEAQLWVERTAEDHHPHNKELHLKAMVWVIERWRHERGVAN